MDVRRYDSVDGGGRAASGTAAEGSAGVAGGRTPGATDNYQSADVEQVEVVNG